MESPLSLPSLHDCKIAPQHKHALATRYRYFFMSVCFLFVTGIGRYSGRDDVLGQLDGQAWVAHFHRVG